MPQHIARWNPSRMVWETDELDLFSGLSVPYSATFATSGTTRNGRLLPLPPSAPATDASECSSSRTTPEPLLFPTPVAQPSANTPENHLRKKPGCSRVTDLSILVENDLMESGGKLLLTPSVADGMGGHLTRSGSRSDEPLLPGVARAATEGKL